MLVTSIYSFSYNVFKQLSQGCKKLELRSKGLNLCQTFDPSPGQTSTYLDLSTIQSFCRRQITAKQILDSSKLKEFADDNFKFDENGRKLLKQVENTVGKGEIACNEKFLLFPRCFLPIWRTPCQV